MKKIIEISIEIINVYYILEKNKNISENDKLLLLNKIKELVKKENELYNLLDFEKNDIPSYEDELYDYDINVDVINRIKNQLKFLEGTNHGYYSFLIYYEEASEYLNYYKFFDLQKELKKIIIKNYNNDNLYSEMCNNKQLEEEYFHNNYNFINIDMKKQLNKKEYKLYEKSKYNYVNDQLSFIVEYWDIGDNYNIIKSLLEFDYSNYNKHYENSINILSNLDDKTKLNTFVKYFGNRNKIK